MPIKFLRELQDTFTLDFERDLVSGISGYGTFCCYLEGRLAALTLFSQIAEAVKSI